MYNVEAIMARKYESKRKTYVYLVKWAGYDEDQNTWEPKQNLISARESNVNKGAMSSDYCC